MFGMTQGAVTEKLFGIVTRPHMRLRLHRYIVIGSNEIILSEPCKTQQHCKL